MPKIPKGFVPLPRSRKARRRLWLTWLVVIALVVGAGWYGAPRVVRKVKAWHARRYAQEALALIESQQWREAFAKANDAYHLSPNEPEALRAIARLLSRRGESRKALEWWERLDNTGAMTLADRRDYTGAALAAEELSLASVQINQLLEAGGPLATPLDLFLAAQLNVRRFNFDTALAQTQIVLRDPRATSRELFSVALLIIGIVPPESSIYAAAWSEIEKIARNIDDPLSLDALTVLAQQPGPAAPAPDAPADFSNLRAPPQPAAKPKSDPAIAAALETHPRAQPFHKLLALELRVRHEPARAREFIAGAVAQFSPRAVGSSELEAGGDDESLKTLVTWLNASGYADETLKLLDLERVSHRRQLIQPYLDAFAATGRWAELKELVDGGQLSIEPVFEHIYLAMARAHLGETAGAANEWQRAIETANTAENFLLVGSYAEKERAIDAADLAYRRAIAAEPKLRPAYAGRLRLALARGQTAEARAVAGEVVRNWPDDRPARLEALYLQLLLGPSPAELEAASRAGQDALRQNPADWNARKTLALARLKSGQNTLALELFQKVRVTGTEPPGALAVRAAVLAANGWLEGARGDARNLGAAELLPEERALIAALLQ